MSCFVRAPISVSHGQFVTVPADAKFATLVQQAASDGFSADLDADDERLSITLAVGCPTPIHDGAAGQTFAVNLGWTEHPQTRDEAIESELGVGYLGNTPTVSVMFSSAPVATPAKPWSAVVKFDLAAQVAGARAAFAVPCRGAKGLFVSDDWDFAAGDIGVMEKVNGVWRAAGAYRATTEARDNINQGVGEQGSFNPQRPRYVQLSGAQTEVLFLVSRYGYSISTALTVTLTAQFLADHQMPDLFDSCPVTDVTAGYQWVLSFPLVPGYGRVRITMANTDATYNLGISTYGLVITNPGYSWDCHIRQVYMDAGSCGTSTTAHDDIPSQDAANGIMVGVNATGTISNATGLVAARADLN